MKAYRIETEITIDGVRHRKVRRLKSDLKGTDLKLWKSIEKAKLREEIKKEAALGFSAKEITFAAFSEVFLKESTASQRTKENYANYLTSILPHFGDMPLVEITEATCADFFAYLKSYVSDITGRPLSSQTIRFYKLLLSMIFNLAVEKNIINKNPVKAIKVSANNSLDFNNFYSPEEVQELVALTREHASLQLHLMVVLAIQHSLRPGELMGLKWSKLSRGLIFVDEALAWDSSGYFQKSTKTSDRRVETLSEYELGLLEKHRAAEIKKHGTAEISNFYVFTDKSGKHLKHHSFREALESFLKKHGLRKITPYGLRHTSATLLAMQNFPLVSISSKLGHKNQSTTAIYTHAVESLNSKMGDSLAEIITGGIAGGKSEKIKSNKEK